MLVLLSPSKTLDESSVTYDFKSSMPDLLDKAAELIEHLKLLSASDIKKLMSVSEKLAALNHERYQKFTTPFTKDNAKPAILTFQGDVYEGLDAASLDAAQLEVVNNKIRILSGLYGVLRPFDLMQLYRLEMGAKFRTPKSRNLYSFWDEQIADTITEHANELGAKYVINAASGEYFKAADKFSLRKKLINVVFKEKQGHEINLIGLHAKKARGLFARFVTLNQPETLDDLKEFDSAGYNFDTMLSSEDELIFIREHKKK